MDKIIIRSYSGLPDEGKTSTGWSTDLYQAELYNETTVEGAINALPLVEGYTYRSSNPPGKPQH